MYVNGFNYTVGDTVLASLSILLVTAGVLSYSFGVKYGNAGPAQAIMTDGGTITQTLLGAFFLGNWPNWIQWLGLSAGLAGVIVIIMQKQKSVKES